MNERAWVFDGGERVVWGGAVAWVVGTAGLAVGAFVDRRRLFVSYLTAFTFVASIALGALLFLMICHAMRARWPTTVQRIVEAIASTFPVLAVLFVPLSFGLDSLYPWENPSSLEAAERALVLHRRPYLNTPFFLARTALYFVIWIVVAELLRRWSLAKDDDPSADVNGKLYRTSAAAMPAVALALSFAAFDWIMSLMPSWSSSMFPVYFFGAGILGALALITASTFVLQRGGFLRSISDSHYYALGRLLLTFTIFWGYAAFFQFMLIWMANLPDETTFYLTRIQGSFAIETVVLVAGRFVLPFVVLLNYRLKRNGRVLAAVAIWMLVFHYVDMHWLIAPTAGVDRFPFHWLDLAALLAVVGLSTSAAVLSLRGRRLLPIHDPRLPEGMAYESA